MSIRELNHRHTNGSNQRKKQNSYTFFNKFRNHKLAIYYNSIHENYTKSYIIDEIFYIPISMKHQVAI